LQQSETRVVLQQVGGTLIVPFPDPVHDAFLSELRASVLDYLHSRPISGLVLDLSAVEILDEHDFVMIRAVCHGAGLMGARIVLAGIRPGVAAGLAMMNLDASWADTALTVDDAMERVR
jgi:rsbT antagonist protein RsbS